MLAGVGGRTVLEAKWSMSHAEWQDWITYRSNHGPLAPVERLERGLAQVAMYVCAAGGMKKKGGGDFKVDDFLPYVKEPEFTLEKAMKAIGVKKISKPKGSK